MKLRDIARAPVESGDVIGLSVAVTRGEAPVLLDAFGIADRESGVVLRPTTPLRAASVSKLLTAALAVRLAEEGRVSLDDELVDHLPELKDWLPAGVTLRRALNHTTGLPDYLDADEARYLETGEPLTEEWTFEVLRQRAPVFDVGRRWAYSNTGFYLAAVALERATGRSWETLMRASLAEPLGLGDLVLCDELIARGTLHGYDASGTGVTEDAFFVEGGVKGDGGVCVTAGDLATFARALERGRYVSADAFAGMCTPTAIADGDSVDYGLGVRLGELGGHRLWGHTGSIGVTVGAVFRFPDDDVTVAVLQNTVSAETDALVVAWRLAEAVLELPPANLGPPALPANPETYVGT